LEGQDDPEHRIAPLVVLTQVNQTHMQKAQLRVIKAIGDLLAIARDEGNGGAPSSNSTAASACLGAMATSRARRTIRD
jgi:hypothetical protein